MCNRYFRDSDKQRLVEAFYLGDREDLPLEIAPSYNIAPTTMQPVIVPDRDTGVRSLRIMRWGLIPFWAKDPRALGLSTMNAKAETLMDKPMWRTPFKKRRCLVPADGYYEWKKLDAKTKQPYAFRLKDGGPFAFAGVWEHWKAPDGALEWDTFSIITTEPNELTATVHNRMPVILHQRDWQRWLDREFGGSSDESAQLQAMLRPFEADAMFAYATNPAVGSVRNNGPELLNPS
jgi:putative SOS response-associated peptidase YedK